MSSAGLKVSIQVQYVSMFCHQNAGQNHDIKTANRQSDNTAKYKCLGMTVANQNCTHEEIKFREFLLHFGSELFVFSPAV
jgi:hypothetical protein